MDTERKALALSLGNTILTLFDLWARADIDARRRYTHGEIGPESPLADTPLGGDIPAEDPPAKPATKRKSRAKAKAKAPDPTETDDDADEYFPAETGAENDTAEATGTPSATLDDVRAMIARYRPVLPGPQLREIVTTLLSRYGTTSLPGIEEDMYGDFLQDLTGHFAEAKGGE